MRPDGLWRAALPGGREALAWQRSDGRVTVRASDDGGLERARFMLALDADHGEFARRFRKDPLLGALAPRVLRPAAATARDGRPRAPARRVRAARLRQRTHGRWSARSCGSRAREAPTAAELARLSPAQLRARGLATHRASSLVRLLRASDFERLHDVPTAVVLRRLGRERGFGPWSCGVVCLEGLGRFDHGKVGDLALIKLMSALEGRWVEAAETAELLAPYEEWQGLAGVYLMAGFARGLVPGADRDGWRLPRLRAARAA